MSYTIKDKLDENGSNGIEMGQLNQSGDLENSFCERVFVVVVSLIYKGLFLAKFKSLKRQKKGTYSLHS